MDDDATAVKQRLSAGGVMRRLVAGDYAVDAVTMAKALVGAWLCRRLDDGTVIRRRITETEAYCGEEDTACHAHKGRTARTDVMYWHCLRLEARPVAEVAFHTLPRIMASLVVVEDWRQMAKPAMLTWVLCVW